MKPCPIDKRWRPHVHSTDEIIEYVETLQEAYDSLAQQLSTANDDLEIAVDALEDVSNWAKAYPLDIFPEPDFKRVRELLEVGGITLDSVSSSNMRHVINGVSGIVSDALRKIYE